jgi:L-malate glycosyltransferase
MYILEVSYGCPSEKYPSNGNFQMDQAKALRDYGHKLVFAALDMRSFRRWRRWGLYSHDADGIPVYEYSFPMGPVADSLRKKLAARGFERLLERVIKERGRPDVVHVHFADTAVSIVEACRRRNIPYVVTEHASSIMDDEKAAAQAEMMKYVYENAAGVIAVSPALARQIERFTGTKAEVVDDIVDVSVFKYVPKNNSDGFRFVSAGYAVRRKGFDLLIDAFVEVLKKYPDSTLTIMGDGEELENLKHQAASRGVDGKINFTGYFRRSEFAEELHRSDCFVLASRHETFGVVYAEAMACGVPVIATRCGGTEGFVNEHNGLMINVDDVSALADAMIYMHEHAAEYKREDIASAAEGRFSPKAVAESITKVLEEALICGEQSI